MPRGGRKVRTGLPGRPFSLGKWIDENGDGRSTMRSRSKPAASRVRASTMTAAFHCIVTIKASSRNDSTSTKPIGILLHNDITVIDHALTRPWTVNKAYRRNLNVRPVWVESECEEGQVSCADRKEDYFLSAEGLLMPAKKDQAPPDLQIFQSHRGSDDNTSIPRVCPFAYVTLARPENDLQ